MLKNSLDLIISRQALDINFFQRLGEMPSVINCQNGELWLQDDGTQLLKPHSPDSYLQYVLSFSYDPNATCEKFDAALLSTFSESENPAEMARHFLEMMGYIIQPARFLTCWFMLTGNGDNGKTTLFETLVQLMSKNAIFSGRINEIEQNRFMIGSLLGKLLLVDDDVDKGTKLPDGMMKKLSEKKLLTGEKKFKDSFEFQSSVAVLLLANNYPQCDDLSHGMRRRAKIVPFNRNFSKGGKDPALFPYIWKNEMSGVLNRLIQGLQRVRQRGDFDEPADCISARETWLTNANPLMAFLKECCEPAEEDCYVSLNHVYQTFTNWKNKNGFSKKTTSQELHSDLKSSGYTSRKINGCQRIYGIRIVLGVS
jgi:putative DNA primase/helicase